MRALPVRLLTLEALATFVVLDLGFRLLGFERMYRLVLRRRRGGAAWEPAAATRQARSTYAAVERATMLYYRRREDCLPKALATFHLLRRQGIPAEICFGIKKFPFAAHTWVEAGGETLDYNPSRLRHLTVIHRIAD